MIFLSLTLYSCKKDDTGKEKTDSKKNDQEESQSDSDSTLTAEELFSSSLVEDIMGTGEDIDLEIYLEEEIFPLVSKSSKVTIDRISSSLYLLNYDDNGAMKNLLIRKFYNPAKDEFVFEKSEIQTDAVKQFVR